MANLTESLIAISKPLQFAKTTLEPWNTNLRSSKITLKTNCYGTQKNSIY